MKCALTLLCGLALAAMAEDTPLPMAKPIVRQVSPGIYEVGKARANSR